MKYYLVQKGAETGPFSAEEISRLHASGAVAPDALIRLEDGAVALPFCEVFRNSPAVSASGDPGEVARLSEISKRGSHRGLWIPVLIPILFIGLDAMIFVASPDSTHLVGVLAWLAAIAAIVCSAIVSIRVGSRSSAKNGAVFGVVMGFLTFVGLVSFYIAAGVAGCAAAVLGPGNR